MKGFRMAQRVARGQNPDGKSSNYLQGCTICVCCRLTESNSSGPA